MPANALATRHRKGMTVNEATPKRGRGRPPGAKNKQPHAIPPREVYVKLRMRADERETLEQKAAHRNMTLSNYMRALLGLDASDYGTGGE